MCRLLRLIIHLGKQSFQRNAELLHTWGYECRPMRPHRSRDRKRTNLYYFINNHTRLYSHSADVRESCWLACLHGRYLHPIPISHSNKKITSLRQSCLDHRHQPNHQHKRRHWSSLWWGHGVPGSLILGARSAYYIGGHCMWFVSGGEGHLWRANAKIIVEIRKLLATNGDITFYYECREVNVDAHNIAKNSLDIDPSRHVWLLDPPNYVNNVLMEY